MAALTLPILVLATVSVVSINQRAATRRLLIDETYGSIADLTTSKIDEEAEAWHRELLAKLGGTGDDPVEMARRFHEAEANFPELGPLVVAAAEGTISYPPRFADDTVAPLPPGGAPGSDGTYGWLMERGLDAEMSGDIAGAQRMFRRAIAAADDVPRRLAAVHGLGRTQIAAGELAASRASFDQLAREANPYDPATARWAVLARYQQARAVALGGAVEEACDAWIDALSFLARYRSQLPADLVRFYVAEIDRQLGERAMSALQEQQLVELNREHDRLEVVDREIETLVAAVPEMLTTLKRGSRDSVVEVSTPSAADVATPLLAPEWNVELTAVPGISGGAVVVGWRRDSGRVVVRRWNRTAAAKIVAWLMTLEGPWQEYGIALVDGAGEVVYASTPTIPEESVPARLILAAWPGFQVRAYPRQGSLDDQAKQDVADYALLLGAAFLAVVAVLAVTTRTMSREMALAGARSRFVSNVSHELKTPLSLIRMFAENLSAGWVPESKKSEYYRMMLGESERLSGVVDNVLDFSRIESGRREYDFRHVDVTELVQGILERYRHSFEAAGIELGAKLPDAPLRARVDREGMAQVLVNLLSNAAKYIREDRRRVTVELAAGDEDGRDVVAIVVADTGVGMRASELERIFTPFWRVDDPRVRRITGSGIGLTIVRHIVDAHGGHVQVHSRPGEGSEFTVVVPREPAPSPPTEDDVAGAGTESR